VRPLNLKEFAEDMRRKGDIRDADLADEILALVDIEEEVAEPYSNLCDDLAHYAPEGLKENPAKAVEWLGDRSHELDEIRELFSEEELSETSIPEAMRERIDALANFETIMREHGGWTEGDLQDGLFALIERAGKLSNDLEYDL
jgi:hypothetical protein